MSFSFPLTNSGFLKTARAVLVDYDVVEAELQRIGKYYESNLAACHKAWLGGNRRAARGREHVLVTSLAAKIVCYVAAMHQHGRKTIAKVEFATVQCRARDVNPRRAIAEPIRATQIQKPSGGKRSVVSLGLMRRANINMAWLIGHMRSNPSQYEFASKGRGRDAAVKATLDQIRKGDHYVAIVDIKDAYGSITRKDVLALGLFPKAVVCSTVFIPPCAPIISAPQTYFSSALRRGLMQGSRTSASVLEKLIEKALDEVNPKFACSYGDDIVLLTPSREAASTIIDALESVLSAMSGGALKLKTKEVRKVGEPMNFCGYHFCWRQEKYSHEGPRVLPSKEAWRRCYKRTAQKLIWVANEDEGEVVRKYMVSWASSHRPWTGKEQGHQIAAVWYHMKIGAFVQKALHELKAEQRTYKSFAELQQHLEMAVASSIPDNVLIEGWPRSG